MKPSTEYFPNKSKMKVPAITISWLINPASEMNIKTKIDERAKVKKQSQIRMYTSEAFTTLLSFTDSKKKLLL